MFDFISDSVQIVGLHTSYYHHYFLFA